MLSCVIECINPPRKAYWSYQHLVSCQLNYLLVNLHILLFCRLQVVPSVVVLINQAIAFPLKSIIRKLIIWEISRGKGTTKEDSQVSSKVPTISKVNGDHTLVINSIRTKVKVD